ncbi:MAG: SRPBCC domain-containing protein [Gammaproteobacteria bacterium]|jgi:uncharacterized protein YndB with AHSA1/START domain|nr:SRPBCC domain-containing protein [Gammaproteobacteria bacterium]
MAEIRHRVGISGSAAEIYQLLTTDAGLCKWWTTDTHGAGEPGSIISFRFGDGGPDFEVVELEPDRKVVWRHRGEMPPAWMGSEISFLLEATEKQTFVNFRHYNWQQSDDFLAHCCTKWGIFMMSIKSCIETGRGQPYPDDVHIDFDE